MRVLLWSLGSALIYCLACSPAGTPDERLSVDEPGADDSPGNGGGGKNGPINEPGGDGFVGDTEDPEDPEEIPAGCGNGELSDEEVCDDGNNASGDGCSANCGQLEPGFSCAAPGKPCFPLARCGDGVVAMSEQCDDGNLDAGDGCSDRCRVELGSKCEGMPSTCSPTTCGDGVVEGAEACDDGNTQPFDGCSSLCLREPNCEGLSCTSECGDGLVIDEECDDGNQISGDGCSADCKIEAGFTCERATACEMLNGECVLRVPAIFRDFTTHPDFLAAGTLTAAKLQRGLVQANLDADGRPVLSPDGPSEVAYIDSADSLSQWYRDGAHAQTHVDELVLFDNGRGGYVNRFDAEGAFFTSTGGANEVHYPGGETLEACEESCRGYVANEDFNAGCGNYCNPVVGDAQRARDALQQANDRLTQAINQYGPIPEGDAGAVPPQIVTAQEEVAEAEAALDQAEAAADSCATECEEGIEAGTAECAATCLPCSDAPAQFCTGGELVEWEGNPLFFPVDGLRPDLGMCSVESSAECARVPDQYGYNGWPFEHQIFPGASQHNFHFTSEVQYWFQYDADMNATLDFTGDDDVWVFINGKLAVDIGGIHVPINGSVTINAAAGSVTTEVIEPDPVEPLEAPPLNVYDDAFTTADFGFQEGSVYKITIFHAERQPEGSSFKLTLSGFEAAPSECAADCGDGVLSFGEECDDGVNDGGYGECAEGCLLGPFCGDGIVQGDEQCDNGPGGGEGCPNCRKITPPTMK